MRRPLRSLSAWFKRFFAAPRPQDRRQLLMMLDEFPALGRLDFFESALAFMAGYGHQAPILIAQSPQSDFQKAYGENNSRSWTTATSAMSLRLQ
nr:type IV secretory system conjugative DNA transfer family protein [uncultured Brevundimonas sp.]